MKRFGWLILVLLLLALLRGPFLREGLFYSPDTATRAVEAWTWHDTGALPLHGIWGENKPPGHALLYLALYSLFGRHTLPFHVAALLTILLSALLLYLLGKHLVDETAGAYAAVGYVLLTSIPYGTSSRLPFNTEYPEMALVLLASLLALKAKTGRLPWLSLFASGLVFGFALLVRPSAVFFAPFLVLASCDRLPHLKWKELFTKTLVGLAGALLPWAAVLGLYAARGGLGDFYLFAWKLASTYGVSRGKLALLLGPFDALASLVPVTLPLFLLACLWLCTAKYRRRSAFRVEILVFALTSLLAGAIGGRGYHNYLIQVMPAEALLAGAAASALRASKIRWHRLVAPALVLLFLVAGLTSRGLDWYQAHRQGLNYFTCEAVNHRLKGKQALLDYLAHYARPGDTLAVFGLAPCLYWESGLLPGVRDYDCYIITGYYAHTSAPEQFKFAEKAYADDLRARRPTFFIDLCRAAGYKRKGKFCFQQYPLVKAVIEHYYVPVGDFDGLVLYRAKEASST